MRRCPKCQTRYTDDTLQYCLQDGSRLTEYSEPADLTESLSAQAETGEVPTVVSRGRNWEQSQVTRVQSVAATGKSNSRAVIAVLAAVLAVLLISAVAGIGALLYFRKKDSNSSNSAVNGFDNSSANVSRNLSLTPSRSPTLTPRSTSSPGMANLLSNAPLTQSTPVPVDTEQIRRDVTDRIAYWKNRAEALDLGSYMDNYASTVDYYNRSGISREAVRNDKNRAFSQFTVMRISITNMSIAPGATGDTATAVFDKEWVFVGNRTSSGKVRSQLQFRKLNGYWLITSEKDLKVYYTR